MIECDSDRLDFLQTSEFAVTVRSEDGTFCAIFDREFSESINIEGRVPVLTCRESDVVRLQLRKGANLCIGTAAYIVREHQPDGTGMSKLVLGVP